MPHFHKVIKEIVQHPHHKNNELYILKSLLDYIFSVERDVTTGEILEHFRNTEYLSYFCDIAHEE